METRLIWLVIIAPYVLVLVLLWCLLEGQPKAQVEAQRKIDAQTTQVAMLLKPYPTSTPFRRIP